MKVSRLPSLAALKAFESVGRHLSFQRAADELCLTPSAVSHQVRTLENQLGTRLFVRRHHELELTRTGDSYLSRIQAIIADLLDATAEVVNSTGQAPLTIQLCPSLAATWMVRRLASFRETYPELEINVVTPYEDPHFLLPEVDVGVLYGTGNWTGVRAEHLLSEEVFPVCSPKYLKSAPPLKVPSDLSQHAIIRCTLASNPEWSQWLEAAGVADLKPRQNLRFHNRVQTIEAAVEGIGVSMARRPSVNEALDTGKLVIPFDIKITGFGAYYLVYPDQAGRLPRISAFRSWIMEEAAKVNDPSAKKPAVAKAVA
jgi:LysR family transcriptional regulator, glycine cleavage system transcriptional activator